MTQATSGASTSNLRSRTLSATGSLCPESVVALKRRFLRLLHAQLAHQAGHALAAHLQPLGEQLGVDAGAAVGLAAGLVDGGDLQGELLVVDAPARTGSRACQA